MPTARPYDAATLRVGRATIFSKLLAGAIIVTPLVMMLFPEVGFRSEKSKSSRARQISPAVRAKVAEPALVSLAVERTD